MNKTDKKILEYLERSEEMIKEFMKDTNLRTEWGLRISRVEQMIEIAKMIQIQENND